MTACPIKDVLPRLLEGLQRRAEGRHYWPRTPREGTADITIAKHRNGPTGTVWTTFKPEMCKFEAIL